jgi:dTDP-glucose pyrophosphorylase
MKGVVLKGGPSKRPATTTSIINKHPLPLYDKPIIQSPIPTLFKIDIQNRYPIFYGMKYRNGVNPPA